MKCKYEAETNYPFFCEVSNLPPIAQSLVSLSIVKQDTFIGNLKKRVVKHLYRILYQILHVNSDAKLKIYFSDGTKEVSIDIADTAYINLANVQHNIGYEAELASFMSLIAPHINMFCDIGANMGFFSFLFATHKDFKGSVNAFEINPLTYKHFNDTVTEAELTDIITTHPFGASDENGQGKIKVGMHSGLASVTKDSGMGTVDVSLRKIDDLNFKDVGLMKIDVEGHEINALNGAKQTIKESQPIIVMETWYGKDDVEGMSAPLKFLENLGYELYRPEWKKGHAGNVSKDGILVLSQITSQKRSKIECAFDVVAIPQSKKSLIESIFTAV